MTKTKKILAGALVAAAPCMLHAQTGDQHFTITGNVKGLDVSRVYLVRMGAGKMETDTGDVVNGAYILKGNIDMGGVAMLTTAMLPDAVPVPANTLSVFIAPRQEMVIRHEGSFSHANITGAPANAEYRSLLDKLRQGKEQKKVFESYMQENPSSPIFVFAFNKYIGDPRTLKAEDVPRVRTFFNMLPDSIRGKASARAFAQQMDKLVTAREMTIGKEAPDFTQTDTAGRAVNLSSFRGKYVLLDFWASWCGPCREENPAVVKAYHKYHEKGFEILSVSLDNNAEAWKKAILQDHLGWTHVSDLQYWDNALVKVYGVQGVPQNFLIDPQGKIVAKGLRGADLENKLSEIYKN